MQELINVTIQNHNGIPMVSSRVVAEQLEKQHAHVVAKIREVLDRSEFCEIFYKDAYGREQPELLLTKDGFILLCMNYQGYNDFKRAYIQKFNDMEKQLSTGYQLPRTMAEALRLAADQAEQIEHQAKQLQEAAPKVTFANAVAGSQNSILIRDLAKTIAQNGVDIGERRLFDWLRKNKYLTLTNMPTQRSIDLGVMEVIERVIARSTSSETRFTAKITAKGQIYFVNKFLSEAVAV